MQNRLVLFDLPPDVPRLANSADALRNLIEENACWVDRFAFLRLPQKGGVVAAAELHLENVRDRAVKKLDGMLVTMDKNGDIISTCDADCAGTDVLVCSSKESGRDITFRMQAAPATASQSRSLVDLSPLEEDAGERIQTLHLPREVHLTVARSTIGGGTGADPWRGGILLARLICSWVDENDQCQKLPSLRELFHDKDIFELGAGSSGLPSMAVASLEGDAIIPSSIVATDGVDEIIDVLTQNVARNRNGLSNSLDTQFLDWNHLSSVSRCAADVILFSDCIYNEAGAEALSKTITHILRPGGSVLGVLPDMRVGLSRFENNMKKCGFASQDVPISKSLDNIIGHGSHESFLCSGGGTKNYRVVFWDDRTVEKGDKPGSTHKFTKTYIFL